MNKIKNFKRRFLATIALIAQVLFIAFIYDITVLNAIRNRIIWSIPEVTAAVIPLGLAINYIFGNTLILCIGVIKNE